MIITADLHLTHRRQDEYRWQVFDWIEHLAERYDHGVSVLILGDLTDRKDNHSAYLVNRIVDRLHEAGEKGIYFTILKGNHDFVDPDTPFFKFLSHMGNVNFVVDPEFHDAEYKVLLLPYSADAVKEWPKFIKKYGKKADFIATHCTVKGSIASNGYELDSSIPSNFFEELGFDGLVLSGDIHVPQQIRNVVYVGSPYHVHFGDKFEPRILEIVMEKDGPVVKEHNFHSPKRIILTISGVSDIDKYEIEEGDQVKVRHEVKREDLGDFQEAKKLVQARIAELGAEIVDYALKVIEPGTDKKKRIRLNKAEADITRETPYKVLDRFAKAQGIDKEYVETAKRIIGQA